MNIQHLTISGMTCGHCVMSVKKELSKLEGVTVQSVSIGSATIAVDESRVERNVLEKAVEEAGYTVTAIQ